MTELLGWLGNLCFLFGGWHLMHRRRAGFLAQAAGNVFYLAYAQTEGSISLGLLSTVLAVFGMVNYVVWKENHEENTAVQTCTCSSDTTGAEQ